MDVNPFYGCNSVLDMNLFYGCESVLLIWSDATFDVYAMHLMLFYRKVLQIGIGPVV